MPPVAVGRDVRMSVLERTAPGRCSRSGKERKAEEEQRGVKNLSKLCEK